MSGLSENVQARLKALAETFASDLPTRMKEIADEAGAQLDASDALVRLSFRNAVHKLAGSAATFGYHSITVVAKRLEHILEETTECGRPITDEVARSIRMLVSELSEVVRRAHSESFGDVEELAEVPEEGAPAPDGTRSVVLMISSDELRESLQSQLEFYGFRIRIVSRLDDAEDLLCQHCRAAVVMDVERVAKDPLLVEQIHRIQEDVSRSVHVLYVSDADDFDTRLLAVRSGGSAFFAMPADVHRVIDTIDSLTSGGGGQPFHVLIIDDDNEQVSYHALILQRAGMITSVVADPHHLFAVLIEAKPDLILMDMYMPGATGPELATMIRQQEAFVGVPIVFLSVETDQDKQFRALSQGGDGFLTKPIKPEHLVTSVSNRIDRNRSMRFYMERDSLTGLLNHTHLMQRLYTEVQRAARVSRSLCFAMIDIDHFKNVNDTYGHLTGDRVIKNLSRLLNDRLRKTDVIGRYGGEEFGVVMFDVTVDVAVAVLDKVRIAFEQTTHVAGERSFSVTFSCGVAGYPDFDGPGPISEAADRALYQVKRTGRNRVGSDTSR
ncbi:MAG: diguanylate cyclase [Spirochaetaceae bacterium]|nr:MAG: diguanylate cyclase [Spirochaetaceae bacterium]